VQKGTLLNLNSDITKPQGRTDSLLVHEGEGLYEPPIGRPTGNR
jgi:hypothetical protein